MYQYGVIKKIAKQLMSIAKLMASNKISLFLISFCFFCLVPSRKKGYIQDRGMAHSSCSRQSTGFVSTLGSVLHLSSASASKSDFCYTFFPLPCHYGVLRLGLQGEGSIKFICLRRFCRSSRKKGFLDPMAKTGLSFALIFESFELR